MNKADFGQLFQKALEQAAINVETEYNVKVLRNFMIVFHGFGHSGDIISVGEALDSLYLGDNRFVYVIDVAVTEANSTVTNVFVRASGHTPVATIEETRNDPPGNGPFKQAMWGKFALRSD